MKKILVTGSSGLIGSEVVRHFDALGLKVFGIDNNMRADFLVPRAILGGIRNNYRKSAETSPILN